MSYVMIMHVTVNRRFNPFCEKWSLPKLSRNCVHGFVYMVYRNLYYQSLPHTALVPN